MCTVTEQGAFEITRDKPIHCKHELGILSSYFIQVSCFVSWIVFMFFLLCNPLHNILEWRSYIVIFQVVFVSWVVSCFFVLLSYPNHRAVYLSKGIAIPVVQNLTFVKPALSLGQVRQFCASVQLLLSVMLVHLELPMLSSSGTWQKLCLQCFDSFFW